MKRRSAEDQEAMSGVPPSITSSMSALTPSLNVNDYKIALGTGAQVTAIDANRLQNFGHLQQQFGKLVNPNVPQKAQNQSLQQQQHQQLPNNPSFASQLTTMQPPQQQNSGEPNWLGVWMQRHYGGEQPKDSADADLEPRPINDQQGNHQRLS